MNYKSNEQACKSGGTKVANFGTAFQNIPVRLGIASDGRGQKTDKRSRLQASAERNRPIAC